MPNYDFSALSSLDFELLVRDLLQEDLKIRLESFKSGKDQGIDLRYATSPGRPELVIQCKHFFSSGLKKLVSHLENSEKHKIESLDCARYILATSLAMTPANKSELISVLSPHCHGPHDIYGRDDLNNLLGIYGNIEKRHFKLWLGSAEVLDRLLHSRVYAQTELEYQRIKERICRYVPNESYAEASAILSDINYCVICGIPGIGKTMLADMLLVSLVARGYEPIRIMGDAAEALDLFKHGKAQVFYYDDFLGQTSLDPKLGKNEDQRLLLLLDRVRQSDTHKFLLTTREYILNQAKAQYERLDASRFDLRRCVVSLDKYTTRDRCKIFYNHLYFSKLAPPYIDALISSGYHRAIVRHRNFNPRVIEWMTILLSELPAAHDYGREFLRNLDEPSRLWDHAFSKQLSIPARTMLLTLGTFGTGVALDDLEVAFMSVHASVERPNIGSSDFVAALAELDGTFVISTRGAGGLTIVAFQNPSVRDFVEFKLRLDGKLAMAMLERSVFFEQAEKITRVFSASPVLRGDFLYRWGNAVAAAFVRTLDARSAEIRQISAWSGIQYQYHRRSLEERCTTALSLLSASPAASVAEATARIVTRLGEHWKTTTLSFDHLDDLLNSIEANPHLSPADKEEAVASCLDGLVTSDPALEAFVAIAHFVETARIYRSDARLDGVRTTFSDTLSDLLDMSDFSDPYIANEAIDSVERVAAALDIDIANDIESAREEASRIPEEDHERLSDDDRRPSGNQENDMADAELDDVFSGLLEPS